MSILSVVQDASSKLGIARPSQLIADTGATSLELQATISEVAQQIRDRYDWSTFKTLCTLTGDGTAVAFAKPTDYARMLKKAKLWPSAMPNAPLTHVIDSDEWLAMLVQGFNGALGAWTLLGGQFQVVMGGSSTPLALADTVKFYYITNKIFATSGGTAKVAVTADDDVFRLDERLLKLGLIYKWKSDKGRPYAASLSDFEDALAVAIGDDKGSKILTVGRARSSLDTEFAFPGTIIP